jgi:hypothetical protein
MSTAAQEAMFLRHLLIELTGEEVPPVIIYSDSQSAIAMAQNPSHHSRVKHLEVRQHFIRDCVESNQIKLEWCNTQDMVADIFTKACSQPVFKHLSSQLISEI